MDANKPSSKIKRFSSKKITQLSHKFIKKALFLRIITYLKSKITKALVDEKALPKFLTNCYVFRFPLLSIVNPLQETNILFYPSQKSNYLLKSLPETHFTTKTILYYTKFVKQNAFNWKKDVKAKETLTIAPTLEIITTHFVTQETMFKPFSVKKQVIKLSRQKRIGTDAFSLDNLFRLYPNNLIDKAKVSGFSLENARRTIKENIEEIKKINEKSRFKRFINFSNVTSTKTTRKKLSIVDSKSQINFLVVSDFSKIAKTTTSSKLTVRLTKKPMVRKKLRNVSCLGSLEKELMPVIGERVVIKKR